MIDRYLALIITWVALWGELSLANIATGMLVAFLIIYLFPTPDRVNHSIHPLGMVKFLARFVVDIVRSSFSVAQAVLFPTEQRLRTKIVTVQLHTNDPFITTVICNAMTLTPGTMTVAIDTHNSEMKLHVLGDVDNETVQHDVYELEKRVLAALTSRPQKRRQS